MLQHEYRLHPSFVAIRRNETLRTSIYIIAARPISFGVTGNASEIVRDALRNVAGRSVGQEGKCRVANLLDAARHPL